MEQAHQHRFTEQESQHDACGIGAVVNISGQRTHRAVDDALKIVEKLEHRTGKDADGITGDGVGIMTQIPHAFFEKTAWQAGKTLPEAGDYGVAMIFFPQDPLKRMRSRKLLEMILSREGLGLLFWRDVPACQEILKKRGEACLQSRSALSAARKRPHAVWILTESCIWPGASMSIPSPAPTSYRCPAGQSYTRDCFWSGSCGNSIRICRMRNLLLLSRSCIPAFPPTPRPRGSGRIPTASFFITAKSTPSAATSTECLHARRRWPRRFWARKSPEPILSWRQTALIRPCWTTHWNFSCTAVLNCQRQ